MYFVSSRVEAGSADAPACAGAGGPQPGRSAAAAAADLVARQRRQLASAATEAVPPGALRGNYTAAPAKVWSEYILLNIFQKFQIAWSKYSELMRVL